MAVVSRETGPAFIHPHPGGPPTPLSPTAPIEAPTRWSRDSAVTVGRQEASQRVLRHWFRGPAAALGPCASGSLSGGVRNPAVAVPHRGRRGAPTSTATNTARRPSAASAARLHPRTRTEPSLEGHRARPTLIRTTRLGRRDGMARPGGRGTPRAEGPPVWPTRLRRRRAASPRPLRLRRLGTARHRPAPPGIARHRPAGPLCPARVLRRPTGGASGRSASPTAPGSCTCSADPQHRRPARISAAHCTQLGRLLADHLVPQPPRHSPANQLAPAAASGARQASRGAARPPVSNARPAVSNARPAVSNARPARPGVGAGSARLAGNTDAGPARSRLPRIRLGRMVRTGSTRPGSRRGGYSVGRLFLAPRR